MTSTQQDRIRLKNLKVAEFASEETLCFSATVLFDGQPIAEAHNDGHGGCTFLRRLSGTDARMAAAEDFASSLPPLTMDNHDPKDRSRRLTIRLTLETLVDHLASSMHADRRLRATFNRDIANKVLFITGGRLLYLRGLSLKRVPDTTALFAELRARHADITILAELPKEDAFALWTKHAVNGKPETSP